MPVEARVELFQANVGASVTLLWSGGEAPATLVEASALPAHSTSPERAPFSLIVRVSADLPLGQGVYGLRLGDDVFDMFMVPIGRTPGSLEMEAVFN